MTWSSSRAARVAERIERIHRPMCVRKKTVIGSDAWKRTSPTNSGVKPGARPGVNAPRICVIGTHRSWIPKMRMMSRATR